VFRLVIQSVCQSIRANFYMFEIEWKYNATNTAASTQSRLLSIVAFHLIKILISFVLIFIHYLNAKKSVRIQMSRETNEQTTTTTTTTNMIV
jgi:hypothetical protein